MWVRCVCTVDVSEAVFAVLSLMCASVCRFYTYFAFCQVTSQSRIGRQVRLASAKGRANDCRHLEPFVFATTKTRSFRQARRWCCLAFLTWLCEHPSSLPTTTIATVPPYHLPYQCIHCLLIHKQHGRSSVARE